LKSDTSKRTLAHGASEALGVRRGAKRLLILVVGLDIFQLGDDMWAIRWQTAEEDQRLESLGVLSNLDKVTGCLWEEQETTGEDECPCELDCERNAIAAAVGAVPGGV
jgi:hypothetical protein